MGNPFLTVTSLPDTKKLHELSALQLALLLRERRITATETASYFLERIRCGEGLGAFSVVAEQAALEQARKVDAMFGADQQVSPLQGVPIVLKDNIAWKGFPMELGSRSREGKISRQSAQVVERLLSQGLVLLGKTHMTEFAFGLSGNNPAHPLHNPWDPKVRRLTGGSSSGTAVAVAASLSPLGLGSDTGGSVRAPAAFHHLVGFKPSSSLVDRQGCAPLGPSLDALGPIAHSVGDAWALLSIVANKPMEVAVDVTLEEAPPLRLAILDEQGWPTRLSASVEQAWYGAIDTLRTAKVELKSWRMPETLRWSSLSKDNSLILAYEAYRIYRSVVDAENPKIWTVVLERLKRGRQIAPQEYQAALLRRSEAQRQFAAAFADLKVEGLLLPCLPFVSPPVQEYDEQSEAVGLWLRAANFLDACAISLPIGMGQEGLPIAVQLVAPQLGDSQLLRAAMRVEALFHQTGVRPNLSPWGLA